CANDKGTTRPGSFIPLAECSAEIATSVSSFSGRYTCARLLKSQFIRITQPRSQFDVNMDLMSSGMARLRDMATAMNAELKAQNQQLDRMEPELSRVSDTMATQNRQMKILLGSMLTAKKITRLTIIQIRSSKWQAEWVGSTV
ncbi:unnamed protein product, partial [Hydatigera taeniaeformis]|uniref:t-SNARE coiled-coil homology domain-containing protein n=1 Tax=Hydatigena taeniaeformis TaxID=6205 RepID=A0A0R3WQZ2_HYDTA